jgi:hypothetical protein
MIDSYGLNNMDAVGGLRWVGQVLTYLIWHVVEVTHTTSYTRQEAVNVEESS